MTYKEYKDFWDIFLNKWLRNHDDFILNDSEGQAFFPKDSRRQHRYSCICRLSAFIPVSKVIIPLLLKFLKSHIKLLYL